MQCPSAGSPRQGGAVASLISYVASQRKRIRHAPLPPNRKTVGEIALHCKQTGRLSTVTRLVDLLFTMLWDLRSPLPLRCACRCVLPNHRRHHVRAPLAWQVVMTSVLRVGGPPAVVVFVLLVVSSLERVECFD